MAFSLSLAKMFASPGMTTSGSSFYSPKPKPAKQDTSSFYDFNLSKPRELVIDVAASEMGKKSAPASGGSYPTFQPSYDPNYKSPETSSSRQPNYSPQVTTSNPGWGSIGNYSEGYSSGGASDAYMNSILSQYSQANAQARAANEKRYAEAKGIYEGVQETYKPGGAFGKGQLAQLERGRGRALAGAEQGLVSSGLYGTTLTAGLPKKWEEEVGVPSRLDIEERRMSAYAQAKLGTAGLIERREDTYPDLALMAQLMQQGSSA